MATCHLLQEALSQVTAATINGWAMEVRIDPAVVGVRDLPLRRIGGWRSRGRASPQRCPTKSSYRLVVVLVHGQHIVKVPLAPICDVLSRFLSITRASQRTRQGWTEQCVPLSNRRRGTCQSPPIMVAYTGKKPDNPNDDRRIRHKYAVFSCRVPCLEPDDALHKPDDKDGPLSG